MKFAQVSSIIINIQFEHYYYLSFTTKTKKHKSIQNTHFSFSDQKLAGLWMKDEVFIVHGAINCSWKTKQLFFLFFCSSFHFVSLLLSSGSKSIYESLNNYRLIFYTWEIYNYAYYKFINNNNSGIRMNKRVVQNKTENNFLIDVRRHHHNHSFIECCCIVVKKINKYIFFIFSLFFFLSFSCLFCLFIFIPPRLCSHRK
jgi:hypothetical protein